MMDIKKKTKLIYNQNFNEANTLEETFNSRMVKFCTKTIYFTSKYEVSH